jgi:hypothetical protein
MDASLRVAYLLPVALIVAGLAYVSTRPSPHSPLDAPPHSSAEVGAGETSVSSPLTPANAATKTMAH